MIVQLVLFSGGDGAVHKIEQRVVLANDEKLGAKGNSKLQQLSLSPPTTLQHPGPRLVIMGMETRAAWSS